MHIEDYDGDIDYISSRLLSTYVIVDGVFTYVERVREEGIQGAQYGDLLEDYTPFELIDLTTPKLGYSNTPYGVCHLSRLSTRYYKQGLDNTNTLVYSDKPVNLRNILYNKRCHKELIGGQYTKNPFLVEQIVCGEVAALALSNSFAISKNGLHFNKVVVGEWMFNHDMGEIMPKLSKEYSFLGEMLEEEINAQVA